MKRKKALFRNKGHGFWNFLMHKGRWKQGLAGQTVIVTEEDGTEKRLTINPPREETGWEIAVEYFKGDSCFW